MTHPIAQWLEARRRAASEARTEMGRLALLEEFAVPPRPATSDPWRSVTEMDVDHFIANLKHEWRPPCPPAS